MPDPVVVVVAKVGIALTKVLLRACDSSLGADLVGDSQELVGKLSRALRRTDESKGQIEDRVSQALATRTDAMRERCSSQGFNPDLLSGACTEVKIILEEIADDGALLLSAVRTPESFPETLREYADRRRMNVEAAAEPYFDELVGAVAAEYSALAPWSPRFQIEAFKSILSGIDEILENSRLSLDAHAVTHNKLDTLSSKLAEVAHHENKPSRVFFGSRPDVVVGVRFIERDEQEQLEALITDPKRHRTVLVGMRGCGKTQLAAALAKQCEDVNWSLVAWVNAVSPESIKSALVELAKELKLDTSDQPTQEQIIARCLNSLRSSEASDRLIIFDNVEDIDQLRGLVPTGEGLRVVATTTNDKGWNYQGWDPIRIGVFDRETSIDYLLTVTDSADREAAYTLAERLGDLPLALAQAAASARNGNLSLVRYLDRLDSYGSERVIRPVPGGYYTVNVATSLWMAGEDTIDSLEDATKEAARRQLGALALLAEFGVPTRWLDPTFEQQYDDESPGTQRDMDEDAHDALTELIRRSIVQQSADRSTTMLHRLQAQVLRENWDEKETAEAYESATMLLSTFNVDRFLRNNTDSIDLIEQFASMSTQHHSQQLFCDDKVQSCLLLALLFANIFELPVEPHGLVNVVDILEKILGSDHVDVLTARNCLAGTYRSAGYFPEAIKHYERVLTDRKRILGESNHSTLATRSDLASTHASAGHLPEAISQLKQVLDEQTRILGPEDIDTLTTQYNLASAYSKSQQYNLAIPLYEQVLSKQNSSLGPNHPHTLVTQSSLALAHFAAGNLSEAISLYKQVLPNQIETLGPSHPYTLTTRENIATAYRRLKGDLKKVIDQYETILKDCTDALGTKHPLTVDVHKKLEAARRELTEQENGSRTEERDAQD